MTPDDMATVLGVTTAQFGPALRVFLSTEGYPLTCLTDDDILKQSYPVFKKFARTLPSLRGLANDTFRDTVHATPQTSHRAARFSTILYVEKPEIAENIGVQGMYISCARNCAHTSID